MTSRYSGPVCSYMSEPAVTSELNASSLMAKDACRTGVTAATLNDPGQLWREMR